INEEYFYSDDLSYNQLYLFALMKNIVLPEGIPSLRSFILINITKKDRETFEESVDEDDIDTLRFMVNLLGFPGHLNKFLCIENLKDIVFDNSFSNIDIHELEYINVRYEKLKNNKYVDVIKKLYKSDDLIFIANDKIAKTLETLILNLDSYTDDQICLLLGMIIPNNVEKRSYILANIVDYEKVLSRTENNRKRL